MILIRKLRTTQPPGEARFSAGWLPDYVIHPPVGNRLIGTRPLGAAAVFTTDRRAVSGGIAFKHNGSSQYSNWVIARPNTLPVVMAASFICVSTGAGPQTAVALGGAILGGGLYTGVGQYTGTTVDSWMRFSFGGDDTRIAGPTAVVGKTYNVIRLSRGPSSHVMYVNGARYSSSTEIFIEDSWLNLSCGTCVRDTTPIFYGEQTVLLGFAAVGHEPGDEWARQWSLNPWKLFAPQQIIIPRTPAGLAPTLTAASAVSIGTTSATPRVTFSR